MTKYMFVFLLGGGLLFSATDCTAQSVVQFEPPIVMRDGHIEDPRAEGWKNVVHAVTSPSRFESFEHWMSYMNFDDPQRMDPSTYADYPMSNVLPEESIVYAVEFEEEGDIYLMLVSLAGVWEAMPDEPQSNMVSRRRIFQWTSDRWAAVEPQKNSRRGREYHKPYGSEFQQLLADGVLTPVDTLTHKERTSTVTSEGEPTESLSPLVKSPADQAEAEAARSGATAASPAARVDEGERTTGKLDETPAERLGWWIVVVLVAGILVPIVVILKKRQGRNGSQ